MLRPVRTRFRYGYPTRVNLATHHDSQAHSSKGTPSPTPPHPKTGNGACGSDGLWAHGFRYSFTTPHRGTFHHSLTVLIRYRSPGSIQPYHVVVADSHGIPRAPRYSGQHPEATQISSTGLSPSTVGHPKPFDYPSGLSLPAGPADPTRRSHNPAHATPAGSHTHTV
jgi:hypothetical protein